MRIGSLRDYLRDRHIPEQGLPSSPARTIRPGARPRFEANPTLCATGDYYPCRPDSCREYCRDGDVERSPTHADSNEPGTIPLTDMQPPATPVPAIHLLALTNWPPSVEQPDRDRLLAPLRTVLAHIAICGLRIEKLVLLGAKDRFDFQYCDLVRKSAFPADATPLIDFRQVDDDPTRIARAVSVAATDSRQAGHDIWVDITSGPKARAALILAAASAIPDVRLICCESVGLNTYQVTTIPTLQQYNHWLGAHGLLVRNYRQELGRIGEIRNIPAHVPNAARLSNAVEDLLGWAAVSGATGQVGPRTDLTNLAEWLANKAVPEQLLNIPNPWKWQRGDRCDTDIRKHASSEALRIAARSSQAVYQLRNLFSHPSEWNGTQTLLFLDLLSYLIDTLRNRVPVTAAPPNQLQPNLYLAVDGDDVGRRFEERLANASTSESADALRVWSLGIQNQLSYFLLELCERWQGTYIARTGDGFLAVVAHSAFDEILEQFRPHLGDATASVGIGPSPKDAYLALKLCKARNRGGGLYLSLAEQREEIAWTVGS